MCVEWPFTPDHISQDRREDGLTGGGIVPNRALRGLQTILCANVQNPTTVIEFPPDPQDQPVRTDSELQELPFRPPCRRFRKRTGDRYCLACDFVHAQLFRGVDFSGDAYGHVAARVKAFKCDETKKGKYVVPSHSLEVERRSSGRIFVHYNCPMLGYRELIFPIIIEMRLVAVLFIGEIPILEEKRTISAIQRRFFGRFLVDRSSRLSLLGRLRCVGEIAFANWQLWRRAAELKNTRTYPRILETADQEISDLERALAEELRRTRIIHVSSSIDGVMQKLSDCTPPELELAQAASAQAFDFLAEPLDVLAKAFAFQDVSVYGTRPSASKPLDFRLLVKSGPTPDGLPEMPDRFEATDDFLSSVDARGMHNSVDEPNLLHILPPSILTGGDCLTLVASPLPLHTKTAVLCVIRHSPGKALAAQPSLQEKIRSFVVMLVAVSASVYEAIAEENAMATFRLFKHEASQLVTGLDWMPDRQL